MKAFLTHFQSFPPATKNGIILVIAGWTWLLFSFYRYFTPGEIDQKVFVSGFLACTIIFKVRSWARVLCMLGNVVAIVFSLFLAAVYFSSGVYTNGGAAVVAMVLLGAATIYLAVPQTAKFYKAHTPTPADGSEVYDDKPADR